jgi:hypothetical protein
VQRSILQTLAAATLLMLPANISIAQQLPRFDIEATCREAQPLGPEDRDPYQGCIRDEGQARAELQRQWAQFDPANRTSCVEETGIGGYPSYVEVLTCLQMYSGAPTTPLKPRRRGDSGTLAFQQALR